MNTRERTPVRKRDISLPPPCYYTGAGSECQEKAYAGLCEALGTPAQFLALFARFYHEVEQFRVAAPRVPSCLFSAKH
jgi:hypothetical protein